MSKEEITKALKNIKIRCHPKVVWDDTIDSDLEIIEQALLKAQENARSEEILQKYYQDGITLDSVRALKKEMAELKEQVPEPKQYLKWEDLEFTNEVKEMKVKLGDNTYEIEYYICNALGLHQPVVILKTSDFIAITIEQFFNDLHLERVEE